MDKYLSVSKFWGGILTLGSGLLAWFVGTAFKKEKILNPDAGFLDLATSWHENIFTDPMKVLAVDPSKTISPDALAQGPLENLWAGFSGSVEGWGHFIAAGWHDVAVPAFTVATDMATTGGTGSLTAAFSSAAGSALDSCVFNEICTL